MPFRTQTFMLQIGHQNLNFIVGSANSQSRVAKLWTILAQYCLRTRPKLGPILDTPWAMPWVTTTLAQARTACANNIGPSLVLPGIGSIYLALHRTSNNKRLHLEEGRNRRKWRLDHNSARPLAYLLPFPNTLRNSGHDKSK